MHALLLKMYNYRLVGMLKRLYWLYGLNVINVTENERDTSLPRKLVVISQIYNNNINLQQAQFIYTGLYLSIKS